MYGGVGGLGIAVPSHGSLPTAGQDSPSLCRGVVGFSPFSRCAPARGEGMMHVYIGKPCDLLRPVEWVEAEQQKEGRRL